MDALLCSNCRSVIDLVNGDKLSFWCSSDTGWTSAAAFESLCHYSFADIKASALAGCPVCTKLEAWSTKHNNREGYVGLDVNAQPNAGETNVWKFRFGLSAGDGQRLSNDHAGARLTFTCHPINPLILHYDSDLVYLFKGFDVSDKSMANTGSERSMDRIRFWLANCVRSHPQCSVDSDPDVYPPRLLCLKDSKICLVRNTSSIKGAPYAALSHSWGPIPQQLTLTTDNQHALGDAIDEASLPPTFRDAIKVTRGLGIEYLWIDSLCIIQAGGEHVTDWLGHSAIMGSIYQNCLINIAAAHGHDAQAGCFVDRKPLEIAPCVVSILKVTKIDDTEDGGFTLERPKRLTPHLLVPEPTLTENVGHFHLDTRAWVCQERLLSPRTVYFSEQQLFWECTGWRHACETVPIGISDQLLPKPDEFPYMGEAVGVGFSWGTMQFDESIPPYSWRASTPQDQYECWLKTLHGYVKRNLTKSSDKLPAIGGIAERTAKVLGDEYLAGLFRSKLPDALLWSCVQERRPAHARSQDTFFSPSWSWASLNGELDFTPLEQDKSKIYCTVITSHVELIDPANAYGQVKSATLTLKAPFLSFDRKLVDDPENWVYHFGQLKLKGFASKKQLLYFDFDPTTLDCTTLALIVVRENSRPTTYPGSGDMEEAGLILAPALEENEQFVRVGVFKGVEYYHDERNDGYAHYAEVIIV